MALLDLAISMDRPALLPMNLDVSALPAGSAPPLLRGLVSNAPRRSAAASNGQAGGLVERLRDLPPADRAEHLLDLVCGQTAAVLGHGRPIDIEPEQAFNTIGFDSLTAIELRNRLNTATGTRLPATLVFDYPTPAALADHLQSTLLPDASASPASAPAEDIPGPAEAMPADLDSATAEELFDLIDAEFGGMS